MKYQQTLIFYFFLFKMPLAHRSGSPLLVMETFFVFLDESRCYRQKRDLTADFRFINRLVLALDNAVMKAPPT